MMFERFCRKFALLLGIGLVFVEAVGAAKGQYGLYEQPLDLTGIETGWTPRNRFLLRPNTGMEYNNFGWTRYRERGGGFDWLRTYDQLGEPWLAGSSGLFWWAEDRTRAPSYGSDFSKTLGRHNSVVIAKENIKNGALRLTIGDAMRTTFTSLTLDLTRFSGVRADAILGNNHELVVLGTRSSDPRNLTRLARTLGTQVVDEGLIMAGGHWEGRFLQGALVVGATLVNNHRFDSLQESGSFFKGTMPLDMNPDTVAVRVTDDSPIGGALGAAAYGSSADLTLRSGAPRENMVVAGVQPVVVVSEGVERVSDHWRVDGQEYVEYLLPVSQSAVGVHVDATVAQDYRVGTRQAHRAIDLNSVEERVRRTPLETMSRSLGNGSLDPRLVGIDYGLSSAMNIGGLNGKLLLGRLDLKWEYARSIQHFQFPQEQIGNRSSNSGSAYFVRGTQDCRWLTFGGEFFSISPKYTSYALDGGNYREGDLISQTRDDYITRNFMGNHFGFYFNETQPNYYRSGVAKHNKIFALVEDNDDDDQYADQHQNDEPVRVRTQPLEAGVYPGWDLDHDGAPDYNRNRNYLPDYIEPFFKYWQEEQVFYWGDDFNNNGVLDYFEDDSLPDFPYYKDERGPHLFLDLRTPLSGLKLRLGSMRVDQIAGAGKNHVDYATASYRHIFPGKARIQWEHEFKLVEDDIPNNTFQYRLNESDLDVEPTYRSDYIEDALNMRDSRVHRGYIGSRWSPIRGVNIINNFRYELNHQREGAFQDGTEQVEDDLNTWALVNKADYAWNWGKLTVRPMFKHTLLKQDAQDGTGPGGTVTERDITEIVPILQTSIQFTDRTSLELGAEGVPFFQERFIDRENELFDFKSQTYLGQLKMKGRSGGFDVFIITGLQYTKKEFDEPDLPSGSFVRSFFQVFLGEQVLAASQ